MIHLDEVQQYRLFLESQAKKAEDEKFNTELSLETRWKIVRRLMELGYDGADLVGWSWRDKLRVASAGMTDSVREYMETKRKDAALTAVRNSGYHRLEYRWMTVSGLEVLGTADRPLDYVRLKRNQQEVFPATVDPIPDEVDEALALLS